MAYKAFHQSVAAGVALAGAGAIVLSSISVLPRDQAVANPAVAGADFYAAPAHRVVTAEVQNAALFTALQLLATGAVGAIKESLGTFTDDIPALYAQIGIGVPGAQWEDPDLLRLSHSQFGEMLFAPLAPLVVGPFTDAVAEALAQAFPSHGDKIREELPKAVEYAFARLVGPIISAIGATGAVHQEIYRAGLDGNPPGQWLALLKAPGKIVEAFLFGGYGDISALITGEVGGERIAAPGLLTPWGKYPEDKTVTDTFPDVGTLPSGLFKAENVTFSSEDTQKTVDETIVDAADGPESLEIDKLEGEEVDKLDAEELEAEQLENEELEAEELEAEKLEAEQLEADKLEAEKEESEAAEAETKAEETAETEKPETGGGDAE